MSKGSRRERELVALYKRAGFATYRPATVRFGENDMFGLFDVMCVSPRHEHVHAVQVKSNKASGVMKWKRHTRLFRALGWRTFYAVPVDNRGWRLIECRDTGREDVVDERDVTCKIGEELVRYLDNEGDTDV